MTVGDSFQNCAICQLDLKTGDRIRGLKCMHLFHDKCVDKWLHKRSGACPVCRIVQCDKEAIEEPKPEDRDNYIPPPVIPQP